jgi:hypothetical protein
MFFEHVRIEPLGTAEDFVAEGTSGLARMTRHMLIHVVLVLNVLVANWANSVAQVALEVRGADDGT